MIEVSGLRKSVTRKGVAVRLEADIKFVDVEGAQYSASTMWFEIKKEYGTAFVNDSYDAFLLVALYLAMYHKTDLRIRGNVSKKFYKNAKWYIQKILCDFSSALSPVEIIVDGFAPTKVKGNLIGTGISCGVDSLSTLYDRFVKEDDPDYKINSLFIFNCGSHGDFDSKGTQQVFHSRALRAVAVANELKLPAVIIDANLHQFRHEKDKDTVLYLSFYSCILSLQNIIKRYYIPSSREYSEIKTSGHYDLAGFSDSYLIPLIQTERTELIIDGCQHRRVDKIKNIADWDIARKYLNVCLLQKGADSTNCGECSKCLRTQLTLEILGKLDNFSAVFDLEKWKKASFNYKVNSVRRVDEEIFFKENVELAQELNYPMPVRKDCYVLDKNVMVINE